LSSNETPFLSAEFALIGARGCGVFLTGAGRLFFFYENSIFRDLFCFDYTRNLTATNLSTFARLLVLCTGFAIDCAGATWRVQKPYSQIRTLCYRCRRLIKGQAGQYLHRFQGQPAPLGTVGITINQVKVISSKISPRPFSLNASAG
jgi:hypothetical protein